MQFVDEVDIHVHAGHGGSGSLSFRREKFVPRGGPDGGNGGLGGSVYAVADPHRNTLVHFQFNPEHKAQRGGNGAGALRTGRGGKDLDIPVPVGTLIYRKDPESGEREQRSEEHTSELQSLAYLVCRLLLEKKKKTKQKKRTISAINE